MGAEKSIPGYSVMTFDTVSTNSNTAPGTNTFTVAPNTITSTSVNTLASPVSPPRVSNSVAPVVDFSASSEGHSSSGQGSPNHIVAENNTSTGLTSEQKKSYIRWDHPVTTLFINNIMKPYYSDITGTQITQLKHEKWEVMMAKFKSMLSQNSITKDIPTENITIRKMQDKWTGLKTKFLSIKEIVSSEGYVGAPGDRKWPYYSMVEDVLNTVSSENKSVNIVSIAQANPPTRDTNPREQVSVDQLQQNVQETDSPVAVIDNADTYTTRSDTGNVNDTTFSETNIQPNRSANTDGNNGDGGSSPSDFSSRKRRRESNDEEERFRDIVEVIERINTQNMIRAQQSSERWIEALKEQGEIALKLQQDHHRQSMELQRAYIDTINGLINRMKESDERWINLLSNFCNPENKRESKEDNDVNKD